MKNQKNEFVNPELQEKFEKFIKLCDQVIEIRKEKATLSNSSFLPSLTGDYPVNAQPNKKEIENGK